MCVSVGEGEVDLEQRSEKEVKVREKRFQESTFGRTQECIELVVDAVLSIPVCIFMSMGKSDWIGIPLCICTCMDK